MKRLVTKSSDCESAFVYFQSG